MLEQPSLKFIEPERAGLIQTYRKEDASLSVAPQKPWFPTTSPAQIRETDSGNRVSIALTAQSETANSSHGNDLF